MKGNVSTLLGRDWLCKIKLNWEELLGQIDGSKVSDVNMVVDDRVHC